MGNTLSREEKEALRSSDLASPAAKSQEYLDMEENFPLNIAVAGESGSGKSTFVNAIRGLNNRDEGAAPAGSVVTTMDVRRYPHPNYPNVTVWDLPGIGTMVYPAAEYLKKVGFEKFNFFIIVSADRFTDNEKMLVKEIQRMKKKFYFVRTNIDRTLSDLKREKDFDEDKTLGEIKENCIRGLERQGVESPQVFLVSSYKRHLYDFSLLEETVERDLPDLKRDAFLLAKPHTSLISRSIAKHPFIHPSIFRRLSGSGSRGQQPQQGREQIQEEVREALQNDDRVSAAAKIQEYLEKERNIPLHIAVTGESGSGKSTFVNAIRGIDNIDVRAAPTGTVETTKDIRPYPHPNYPNVMFWDLPGVGTTNYPADAYLKLVGFKKFDFFIIISANRFTENDVKLAKEIQKMKKKFYFVRSKIDNNIRDEGRSQKEFDAERTLTEIRESCIQGLKELGVESQVFLVSSIELHLYDFPLLEETLEGELPDLKRDAFLLAMPNISLEVIKKKKRAMNAKIVLVAALSAAVAAVPVPGLSAAVDVAMLVGVVNEYVHGFGLDIPSLQTLAKQMSVPLNELMKVIESPLAATDVTADVVLKLLEQYSSTAVSKAVEEAAKFIPMLGIVAPMVLSFTTTFRGLYSFLNELADDAQRVFQRALSLSPTV